MAHHGATIYEIWTRDKSPKGATLFCFLLRKAQHSMIDFITLYLSNNYNNTQLRQQNKMLHNYIKSSPQILYIFGTKYSRPHIPGHRSQTIWCQDKNLWLKDHFCICILANCKYETYLDLQAWHNTIMPEGGGRLVVDCMLPTLKYTVSNHTWRGR